VRTKAREKKGTIPIQTTRQSTAKLRPPFSSTQKACCARPGKFYPALTEKKKRTNQSRRKDPRAATPGSGKKKFGHASTFYKRRGISRVRKSRPTTGGRTLKKRDPTFVSATRVLAVLRKKQVSTRRLSVSVAIKSESRDWSMHGTGGGGAGHFFPGIAKQEHSKK